MLPGKFDVGLLIALQKASLEGIKNPEFKVLVRVNLSVAESERRKLYETIDPKDPEDFWNEEVPVISLTLTREKLMVIKNLPAVVFVSLSRKLAPRT